MKNALLSLILVVFLLNFCHADQNTSIEQGQSDIPLVINELMASNRESGQDPQGQYDDWIEIYNYGTGTVDMGGMYMTDNLNAPAKWQIPTGTTIPSRGYLLIWADEDTSDSGLHADFKLSADGEQIGLFDTDGTLIDSVTFSEQTADISYGRYPDGDDNWLFFNNPTPGAHNIGGYAGQVAGVQFNHSRGFYDEPFSVTITTETPGAIIRYTTDGSTPSETDGRTYTGPVQISTTTPLRAMAYKTDWLSTNIETQTYIFLDSVIVQTQQQALDAGYPDSWSGYPADYEMDPEVYDNPDYSNQMVDALRSVPTLSIVTDKEYLFDSSVGIYTNPLAEGGNLEWERPTSAELFCPDGSMEFQVNCGLRLQGGHSRHPYKCPKHSFSLRFRDIYGPTTLDYPLFGDDRPVKSFDTLQLRGFFNNAWTHWSPDQRERAQYTHDQWARDTMTDMGHPDALQGFIVHLYINGMYWGIYNLHERPDADHYAAYNDGDGDDIDAINGDPDYVINDPLNTGSVSDGTIDAWHDLKSAVTSRNWQAICEVLDVNNFIDWTILNYFEGNTDIKRGTNWRAAGGGSQRRPWRFYSWDAEHIFESIGQNNIGVEDPTSLYRYLSDIDEFNIRFYDRVHKHLFNNGALTKEKNLARWNKLSEEVQLAVIAESARWGDYRRDVHSYSSEPYYLYTKNEFWVPENDYVVNNYLPYRTTLAISNVFPRRGMYPNVDAPVFNINGSYQHGGQVAKNSSFSITSDGGAILYSLDGTDPRTSGTSQQIGNAVTIVSGDASMRVLVPASSVSNNWKGGGSYSDINWTTGTGGVGYEANDGYENYIEIDLYDQMYGRQASCYIRIPFNITQDIEQFGMMSLRMRYDDGFIAYINGAEVARRNFDGTPAWNSIADTTHDDSAAVNFEDIDITSYMNSLVSGDNILAIQGLNANATSSDFLISAELVAYEVIEDDSSSDDDISPSIIEYTGPITLTESTHIKARVLGGSTWSALNEATYSVGPVADSLSITEIMYHPQNDPNEEFIELTNVGDEAINLNLVKFTNGIDFIFPSLELAPGEYVVVVQDITAFQDQYGTDITVAGQYSGRLSNAGEKIELKDAAGQTILEFNYKDDWYPTTDGDGFSLTHKELYDYSNDPDNWLAASPTPGQ